MSYKSFKSNDLDGDYQENTSNFCLLLYIVIVQGVENQSLMSSV
jgi:hypothetical protein